MKNFYFTVSLLVFCCTLFAQEDYPFLTDGKQWVQAEYFSGGINPTRLTYFEFTLGEHVVVDGVEYVEAFRDTVVTQGGARFAGLLREADGRLLILRNGGIDTLLDFKMEVGDTMIIEEDPTDQEHTQYMVLRSTDSLTILDGSLRKRLNFELNNVGFDGGGFGVSWVDGIGSTRGTIFDSFCSTNTFARSAGSPSCQSELICVKDANERLLYNSTEDEIYDCNKVDVISSTPGFQLPEGTFKVFPNPATNFVVVEINGQYPLSRLIITDLSGRSVLDRTLTVPTTEDYRIELNELPGGMYNLAVFTRDGEWSALRLVVR